MKKLLLILLCLPLIYSCGDNNDNNKEKKTVKGTNIIGEWHHEISKMMGGYRITSTSLLTIIRNGPGDYEYKVKQTTVDEMYGGNPKTSYYNGKLNGTVTDRKFRFSSGNYGERGGYIVVPEDYWDDYNPENITINFDKNRGNTMIFSRNVPNNKYEKSRSYGDISCRYVVESRIKNINGIHTGIEHKGDGMFVAFVASPSTNYEYKVVYFYTNSDCEITNVKVQ
tara:strand:- start:784 stop:1458 length:675 start_codon:yes stop_codon:yes gene_type:complete